LEKREAYENLLEKKKLELDIIEIRSKEVENKLAKLNEVELNHKKI
jgi:hypothetical protein